MKIAATARLAVQALARSKMRSLLTTLGVVIGVCAVVVMQAMGTGATELVTGEISGLGTNMLILVPGAQTRQMGGGALGAPLFVPGDVEAIRREAPAVAYASATNLRAVRAVVGENNRMTNLYGVDPDYFAIRQWGVSSGRLFDEDDARTSAKVCVIGQTVRQDLFGAQDPVGSELRVHDTGCQVIGVLESKGASAFGMDQDDVVFMPTTTYARRVVGDDKIAFVTISAVSEARTDEAKRQVEEIMRERRHILPGEEDDFNVQDMREIQAILGTVTGVLTKVLAGVAAISLLVGGIGIMNIMLVSVTERTREIGIRMAVGARSRDILAQFLVESIVLSTTGGLIGVALGALGAWAAATALHIPFAFPPGAAFLALGFSVLVGVVFGVFPARKAAHLDPIVALRFE